MPAFSVLLMAAVVFAAGCGESADEGAARTDAATSSQAGKRADDSPSVDPHARRLATSPSHTCALRKAGLFCWGANDKGQLGDESSMSSETPVHAKVAGDDVVEVAVHTARTCVRKRSGKVACWGGNDSAQLGDGSRTDSRAAVEPRVDDVKQLALDEKSACALRADGRVWCWGASPADKPDDGSTEPSAIEGIADAVELRSSAMNTFCARTREGATRCWRIEAGSWTTPTDAPALNGASRIALASAQEVCGVLSSSDVVCQDLSSGMRLMLQGSRGTSAIEGGLLTLCGGDNAGAWYCWSILSPAVLQTVGAQRRELTRGPFFEFSTAAYRYCGLEASGQVQCMESNAGSMQFSAVSELPD